MKVQQNLIGTALENGYEILQEKGLAIVGMSPGNSYFKKDTIDALLRFCAEEFSKVRIMVADKPMEHTYRAMGNDKSKSKRKARLNGNTLQNHCQRSIDETVDGDVTLLEWVNEITPHQAYQRELQRIEELYQDNLNFRTEAQETTRTVLEGNLKEGIEMESAVEEGVHYLLKELAFLSASPEMFGVERVAYVYHHKWEIYEDFVAGSFDGQKRSDLGCVVVN